MRKALIWALLGLGLAAPGHARELGTPAVTPAGAVVGLPTLQFPPGVYVGATAGIQRGFVTDDHGNDTGIDTAVESVAVNALWVTPWRFLGGQYRMGAVLPLVHPQADIAGQSFDSKGAGELGLIPVDVVWDLGGGWRSDASLGFAVPVGKDRDPSNPAVSATDFWTITSRAGISYDSGPWSTQMQVTYEHNLESETTKYRSGDVLGVQLATMYNWKPGFGIGPALYRYQQINDDENNGSYFGGTIQPKSRTTGAALVLQVVTRGVPVSFALTHDFDTRNTAQNTGLWIRPTFKF